MKRSPKILEMMVGKSILGIIWLILSLTVLTAAQPAAASEARLVGVKIYEPVQDFPGLFNDWERLGINTAFVSVALAENPAFMDLARARRIPVFVIIPVFFNPEELVRRPDWFAITGSGQPAKSDWVEFVCPNRPDYRRQRLDYIRRVIEKCRPDGISIDFIRYFAFWEMVYPDAVLDPLQNTCFCSACRQAMAAEKTIGLPGNLGDVKAQAEWIQQNRRQAWAQWKCRIIASMVGDIAAAARMLKPDIRLNIHLVPWQKKDFNDAQHTVVAQDVPLLAEYVDYLSPMCYAHMVKRPASWVHQVVADIHRQTSKPILPSIQVAEEYITQKLTVQDFAAYLREALKPPSRGVVFWNWVALASDPAKMAVVRDSCTAPNSGKK